MNAWELLDRLRAEFDETIAKLRRERAEAITRAEAAEVAFTDLRAELDDERKKVRFPGLDDIARDEPWQILRVAQDIHAELSHGYEQLDQTADRLEREHAETAKRDRLIEKLADILGDFAVADEYSGERNDMQLARLLVGRGVTLAEAVDQ